MKFFLTELKFLKGDTKMYFKQITLFEKKNFTENFCENDTYFLLNFIIIFQIVLLRLSTRIWPSDFEKCKLVENTSSKH